MSKTLRSSADTLDAITNLVNQLGGTFSMVFEPETQTYLAVARIYGQDPKVGISTESLGEAVNRCLDKMEKITRG